MSASRSRAPSARPTPTCRSTSVDEGHSLTRAVQRMGGVWRATPHLDSKKPDPQLRLEGRMHNVAVPTGRMILTLCIALALAAPFAADAQTRNAGFTIRDVLSPAFP